MRVRVLGRCEVEADGKVVALRHKAAELFGLLALGPGALPRAQIAQTLWPDADAEDARHNLRQTLVALRGRLGAAPLSVSGDCVGLLPEGVAVDLWDRDAAWQGAPSPEALREARRFLPAATGDWVSAARVAIEERLVATGLRLGEACLNEAPERSLAYAEAAAAHGPDLEAPRALAVRARLALGDRTGAERAIEAYERDLGGPSRLRGLLAPDEAFLLSGLDPSLLGSTQRLSLAIAAIPALVHRPDAARRLLESALAEAPEASPNDRARAETALAGLAIARGDVLAAEALARRARATEGASAETRTAAEALLARHLARVQRHDEALALAQSAADAARMGHDLVTQARALRTQGAVLLMRHRFGEAQTVLREARDLALRVGDHQNLATIRYNIGFGLSMAGRDDAAADEWEAALRDAPPPSDVELRLGLARIRETQGRWREAGEAYALLVERLEGGENPFVLAQALTCLADLDVRRGDFESARRRYREAVAIRRTIGDRLGLMTAYKGLGTVAHATGDRRAAERELREALRFSQETNEPMAGASVRVALARLLADEGRPAEALATARRARRGILALKADVRSLTADDTLSLDAVDVLIAGLEAKIGL